jgi:hypothetical protein
MALDPRIPALVQPIQVRSPLAIYGDFARMRAIQEAERDRDEARQERATERRYRDEDRARAQAGRDVFAKTPRKADGSLDYARISSELAGIDPETSVRLSTYGRQQETADLQHRKALLEQDLQTLDYIGQVMGAANDQPGWDQALGRLQARGIPIDGIQPVFSKEERERLVTQGLSYTERVNAELAKLRATANSQNVTVKWKGRAVQVPFNPDTQEYTMPDGTKQKFAEHYERPLASEGGGGADRVATRQEEADKRERERLADRWKADAIADLNKERRKPAEIDPITLEPQPRMTQADYDTAMRQITASWREMRGDQEPTTRDTSLADAARNTVLPPHLRTGPARPLRAFAQPPVRPSEPVTPMGPTSSAAAPAMPQASTPAASPATNAPSMPTVQANTPTTTSPRTTPSVPPPSTPAQHGELRAIPGVPNGVARYDQSTGKWIRVR